MTCGMYDGAGRFMVEVGLPAKSGVSGVLMVMAPGLFGFATFSPRLNKKGNSARGIDFCKRLVQCYRLHMFEPLAGNNGGKIDPRQNGWKDEQKEISNLAWAASVGDDEATKLRDIFLSAVCRIAESSSEGLASNKENIIKEKYRQHFGVELDQKLLEKISKEVRKHPEDYKCLERLSHKAYMTDAMKEVIFNAMVEIAMSDGIIDRNERRVAIRIAEGSLGMNKAVANLQIDRYEKQVGHRFDSVDSTSDIYKTCHRGSILDHGPSILGSIDFKDYNLYEDDDDTNTNTPFVRKEIPSLPNQREKEEAALLRIKIRQLGQRLAAVLHHHKAPPE
jgi:tellurite resistance protein